MHRNVVTYHKSMIAADVDVWLNFVVVAAFFRFGVLSSLFVFELLQIFILLIILFRKKEKKKRQRIMLVAWIKFWALNKLIYYRIFLFFIYRCLLFYMWIVCIHITLSVNCERVIGIPCKYLRHIQYKYIIVPVLWRWNDNIDDNVDRRRRRKSNTIFYKLVKKNFETMGLFFGWFFFFFLWFSLHASCVGRRTNYTLSTYSLLIFLFFT